jgi:hypothetical protein
MPGYINSRSCLLSLVLAAQHVRSTLKLPLISHSPVLAFHQWKAFQPSATVLDDGLYHIAQCKHLPHNSSDPDPRENNSSVGNWRTNPAIAEDDRRRAVEKGKIIERRQGGARLLNCLCIHEYGFGELGTGSSLVGLYILAVTTRVQDMNSEPSGSACKFFDTSGPPPELRCAGMLSYTSRM